MLEYNRKGQRISASQLLLTVMAVVSLRAFTCIYPLLFQRPLQSNPFPKSCAEHYESDKDAYVCQWVGVLCTAGRVTTFGYADQCGGLLHVHRLPRTMLNLTLGYNGFTGPLDLSGLPPAMEIVSLELKLLTGMVNLTAHYPRR